MTTVKFSKALYEMEENGAEYRTDGRIMKVLNGVLVDIDADYDPDDDEEVEWEPVDCDIDEMMGCMCTKYMELRPMKKPMSPEAIEKMIVDLLEEHYGLPSVNSDECYFRIHDDNEGREEGLELMISCDGDIWVRSTVKMGRNYSRTRTIDGGGRSPRMHNALKILALAIKLDNEKRPITL